MALFSHTEPYKSVVTISFLENKHDTLSDILKLDLNKYFP